MEIGRILTAMVTPMWADGSLDIEQAKRLAAALLESGSEGVVLAGTTGESPTLEFEEERQLFSELLPVCHERGGVLIAGTGSNSTATAVESSERAQEIGVDGLLREKHAISNPLMLHIPTEDGFVDKETQKAMHEGLDDHPKVTLHDYEGMDHGFATQFGKRRDEENAQLADKRTMAFFAEHLG